MKKAFAWMLTVLMLAALFPAGIVAQADSVTVKPFYVLTNDVEGDMKYIYQRPKTWVDKSKLNEDPTKMPVLFTAYDTSGIKASAKALYEDFSKRPAGTRYLGYAAMATMLKETVVDVVDMTRGVTISSRWLDAFLQEYKSLGGPLDGISVDLEYNGATSYYIATEQYEKGNTAIYKQITENAVYQTKIRPQLVARGFQFYTDSDPAKLAERSEIWTIQRKDNLGGISSARSIWNQVIQSLMVEYINEASYNVMVKYYPDAILSDYKVGDVAVWEKSMDHQGGLSGYSKAEAGNASSYNAYDYEPGRNFYGYASEKNRSKRSKYQKPASHNNAVFEDDSYIRALWDVNNHKRMVLSDPDGKRNSWITFYNYGTTGTGYGKTPYYTEVMYHLGMTDPNPFYGYIIKSEVISKGDDDPNPDMCEIEFQLQILDDIMAELTRVAGASDRKAIATPVTWNEGFFYSGLYAGGRNIWRITPDTAKVSVAAFKVKDTAPTFRVGDVTITFPQGRIITDGKITEAGSCGYWVETPANVTPVITTNAGRYQNDPSFYDAFDYATGEFTANSVLPDTFWTVSGSATIVENGGNKAVSLSGSTTLTNTKVPELITAGDYYAKQQSWDVTVKLSGNYGTVTLFSAGKGDGGVKISGGKVYYDQAGTYQEIPNLTLSDGTYIVRRILDFRTAGKFTCTYAIYDTAGKRLGGGENIPVAITATPVTEIKISVAGAIDSVQIDDYKLYPIGVTTNLDLYNAEMGRKLSDPTAAQTKDVVYRLSWMNASSQYRVARIYDVKSGTILKKVEMAPGMDGVVTGIAQSGGKAIQIAVDVQSTTAPAQPNYDNGNFGWTALSESIGLATGPKPANTDNTPDTPDVTPPTDGAGEEGGNIYDIIEDTTPTPTDADPAPNHTTPDTTQKRSNTPIWIVVLVVAVVAGIGVAVYFLIIKKKRK